MRRVRKLVPSRCCFPQARDLALYRRHLQRWRLRVSVQAGGRLQRSAMTFIADARPRGYWAHCGLVIAGGLVLSLGILCLRAASASDAWQYLFWRGIGFGCSLSLLAAWRHGSSPLVQIGRLGGFAWVSVLALVASQVLFVTAIKS